MNGWLNYFNCRSLTRFFRLAYQVMSVWKQHDWRYYNNITINSEWNITSVQWLKGKQYITQYTGNMRHKAIKRSELTQFWCFTKYKGVRPELADRPVVKTLVTNWLFEPFCHQDVRHVTPSTDGTKYTTRKRRQDSHKESFQWRRRDYLVFIHFNHPSGN